MGPDSLGLPVGDRGVRERGLLRIMEGFIVTERGGDTREGRGRSAGTRERGWVGEWVGGGVGEGQRLLTVLVAMSLLPAPASVPVPAVGVGGPPWGARWAWAAGWQGCGRFSAALPTPSRNAGCSWERAEVRLSLWSRGQPASQAPRIPDGEPTQAGARGGKLRGPAPRHRTFIPPGKRVSDARSPH